MLDIDCGASGAGPGSIQRGDCSETHSSSFSVSNMPDERTVLVSFAKAMLAFFESEFSASTIFYPSEFFAKDSLSSNGMSRGSFRCSIRKAKLKKLPKLSAFEF